MQKFQLAVRRMTLRWDEQNFKHVENKFFSNICEMFGAKFVLNVECKSIAACFFILLKFSTQLILPQ